MRSVRPADYPGCTATILEAERVGGVLRSTSWGLRDAALAIAGGFVLAVVTAVAILSLTGSLDSGSALIVGMLVPWVAMAGWPIWAASRYGNGPRLDLGLRLRLDDVGWGVVGGVVALVLGSIAAVVTSWLLGDFESAAGQAAEDIAEAGATWELAVFAVLALVGAPFVEELLFRGMLWAGLRRRGWAAWPTGIVTSLAFALFHIEISRILVLFVIGGVLGVLRERTGALGAPMVAHAINNLPGAVAIFLLA